MFHVCERWVDTRTDCNIDPAVLLSHLGWVAQPWVTEGPKPSVCRWLSIRHLVFNWLKPSVCWLNYFLTPTCFCCSSTYLHRCISWLTAQSRVNMLQVGKWLRFTHSPLYDEGQMNHTTATLTQQHPMPMRKLFVSNFGIKQPRRGW